MSKSKARGRHANVAPSKAGEAPRIESGAVIEVKREGPLPKAGEKSQTEFRDLSNSCVIGL